MALLVLLVLVTALAVRREGQRQAFVHVVYRASALISHVWRRLLLPVIRQGPWRLDRQANLVSASLRPAARLNERGDEFLFRNLEQSYQRLLGIVRVRPHSF